MAIMKEFKEFAMRGNVLDLAVGVIIGGAFGAIVNSLVEKVIMPPIGVMLGGVNFSSLTLQLKEAVGDKPAVVIGYGEFINSVVTFLIIAFCVFMIVKAMNKFQKKQEAAPAVPAAPPRSEVLLEEIRDLLKK
jgi:large conductance mechanosensitive channel